MLYPKMLIFVCLMGLTACTGVSYEEPTSGPLAQVRFSTDFDGLVNIRQYENNACEGEQTIFKIRNEMMLNSPVRDLNMPLSSLRQEASKEVHVPAGKTMHLLFDAYKAYDDGYMYRCGNFISPVFEQGKMYELHFSMEKVSCSIRWSEIKQLDSGAWNKSEIDFIDSKIMPNKNCLSKFKESRLF